MIAAPAVRIAFERLELPLRRVDRRVDVRALLHGNRRKVVVVRAGFEVDGHLAIRDGAHRQPPLDTRVRERPVVAGERRSGREVGGTSDALLR